MVQKIQSISFRHVHVAWEKAQRCFLAQAQTELEAGGVFLWLRVPELSNNAVCAIEKFSKAVTTDLDSRDRSQLTRTAWLDVLVTKCSSICVHTSSPVHICTCMLFSIHLYMYIQYIYVYMYVLKCTCT